MLDSTGFDLWANGYDKSVKVNTTSIGIMTNFIL